MNTFEEAVYRFKEYTGKIPRAEVMNKLYVKYRDSKEFYTNFTDFLTTIKWLNGAY